MSGVYRFFPTYFSLVYRNFQKFINNELKEYDITSSEFPYLVVLSENQNGILQDEICKKTSITKSAATRALQSLEAKGYIYRKMSKHSQRHFEVFLYQKGVDIVPIIQSTLDKWTDWLLSDFSDEEKDDVTNNVRKIKNKAIHYKEIVK